MYTVILPAAGSGTRMNLGYNKLFHRFAKRTVIEHTVAWFLNDDKCNQIIIVVNERDQADMCDLFHSYPRIEIVLGGSSRQESIYNALDYVREHVVLVHDGARPFVNDDIIDACYDAAAAGFGAVAAVSLKDTIKQRNLTKENVVEKTLSRSELVAVQTPQAFPFAVLQKANEFAKNAHTLADATDDASLVEKYTELEIKIIEGCQRNIKFTTEEDIAYFDFLIKKGRT